MANEFYVTPVRHSTASAVASTAAGGAIGAVSGGVKGWLTGLAAPVAVGAVLAGGVGLLVAWPLFSLVGVAGTILLGTAGALAGGVAGATVSMPSAGIGAVLGSLFGGAKGASRAADQVTMERGAAVQMQAQIEAYKYQALANAHAANAARFSAPAHMNVAASRIQAGNDNVQYDGRLAGAELAAAR